MRKKIVAANWKMNLMPNEGLELINKILFTNLNIQENNKLIFCVPFTHLYTASDALLIHLENNVILGAQNCHPNESGAYTGEISLNMLIDAKVGAVIIGHSERRQYFSESNEFIKQKVDAILHKNLMPIFCCGEPLNIREANSQNEYVAMQIQESILHLSAEQIAKVVIAYEPIWAIGTGVTASTQQAQDMHAYIREVLANKYGEAVAQDISILYGGSCNASNAQELFSQVDVDGGLIGGAALKAETFLPIIAAMNH